MSVSGRSGVAYDRLCKVTAGHGWKVGLEVGDGDPKAMPPKPSRLTKLWVRGPEGIVVELAAAPIPVNGRLNDVADLLLDDLQVV